VRFKIFILVMLLIMTGFIVWLFCEIRQNEIERKRLEDSVAELWKTYEFYHHNQLALMPDRSQVIARLDSNGVLTVGDITVYKIGYWPE